MEVRAKLRFLRKSPKKVRLVTDLVRGMKALEAENQLRFLNKSAAKPVLKLLQSAMANAEHNFNLQKENLYIKTITADDGPTLKRWMPRAFGRATNIRKRTSHVHIVLDEIVKKEEKEEKKSKKEESDKKTIKKNK